VEAVHPMFCFGNISPSALVALEIGIFLDEKEACENQINVPFHWFKKRYYVTKNPSERLQSRQFRQRNIFFLYQTQGQTKRMSVGLVRYRYSNVTTTT